jgi:hypothetical protein
MATLIVDIECYKDYFLALFKEVGSDKTYCFELHADAELDIPAMSDLMQTNTTVSFNGNYYDLFMIEAALQGRSNADLKKISDDIITSGKPSWMIAKNWDIEIPRNAYGRLLWNHIDLIDTAPGKASLKIYGGRLNAPKLQDLPIEPSAFILPEQRKLMREYCLNDLETTELLYDALGKEIELRTSMSKQYRVDLRSKGGAQVASAVLKTELQNSGVTVKKPRSRVGETFKYDVPDFIEFKSDVLKDAFEKVKEATFKIRDNGQVALPESLDNAIRFEGGMYKFGIGGIHSQESKQSVVCDENHILAERDVASMYPNIILGQGMYPNAIGPKFLDVYQSIVERRLKAKHEGDKSTSDSLKLVINSSFGLFGSKYSFLYAPELMIQVTITGQLCLLMLIERITSAGAKVVSANTDGVVSLCHKDDYSKLDGICFDWELQTGLELEETRYKGLYSRDVNSYVAIMESGKIKGKGAFAEPNLSKNPQFSIINDAIYDYLGSGKPVEETICACDDVTKFLMVRSVTGGATHGDKFLGKSVRFYYSTGLGGDDCIRYAGNGNKVPMSDGSKPMMQLVKSIPKDLDRQRYVFMAKECLKDFGL